MRCWICAHIISSSVTNCPGCGHDYAAERRRAKLEMEVVRIRRELWNRLTPAQKQKIVHRHEVLNEVALEVKASERRFLSIYSEKYSMPFVFLFLIVSIGPLFIEFIRIFL